MKIRHFAVLALLCLAPEAIAQRSSYQQMMDFNRLISNRVSNDMTMRNMCDDWRRKGQVPRECEKYASPSAQSSASSTGTRFTPVAGDDSVKQLADSLGNTPEERRQILQLAAAGKELFAQKYEGKGWDNTLAGAMTFFVVASYIVSTHAQPSAEAEVNLFASLDATLAQSDIARASDAEKTGLYNVLLASAGLPLVVYVDGKQAGNAGQVEQARAMADGFSRRLFNMELNQLVGMLGAGADVSPGASTANASAARPDAGGGQELDGRYDCQMAALQFDGVNYVTQYRPTGMWFTIKGGAYSAQSGGGRVDAGSDAIGLLGGAYDGWRGARRGDAIVFRKDDYGNPRPGESIKSGDFRCGRRQG